MSPGPRTIVAIVLKTVCALLTMASRLYGADISYGGRLTGALGEPLPGPVDITFNIYTAASATVPTLTIPQSAVPLVDGIFQVTLTLPDDRLLDLLGDGQQPLFIEVVSHGKTYPRQLFGAVPFALRVPVDNAKIIYDSEGRLTLGSGMGTTTGGVTSVNGQSGSVSLTTDHINETAGRRYFSQSLARQSISSTGLLSYNSTSGVLALSDTLLTKAGGTMTGSLSFGGTLNITNLADPIAAGDAAKKSYVDSKLGGQPLVVGTPSPGQVVKWDGSKFALASDELGQAGGGIASLNTLTSGSQSLAVETPGVTAGTRPNWTADSGTSTHRLTIPMASASGVTAGLISKSDFDAFSLKQDAVTPSSTLNVGTIASNMQNGLQLKPYGTEVSQTGELRFAELTANGAQYIGLKAPDALSSNTVWTLPPADGPDGYVLSTNGTGALSWISPTTGSVTSISTGTGLAGGPINGVGTISLADVGTAGTYTKVTTNAQGQVTSGGSLAESDIPNLSASKITSGSLSVSLGGTGAASFTNNGVLVGNGASPLSATTAGTQYQVLRAGSGGAPSFGAINLDQGSAVTGLLPLANGGTGAATAAQARTNLGLGSAALFNVGTAASQVVQLDASAKLPAVDGSLLTGVVKSAGGTITGTLNLPINGLVAGTNQLVLSGGNVGIGTSNPTTAFQVNGNILATNNIGQSRVSIKGTDSSCCSSIAELNLDRDSLYRGGGIRISATSSTLGTGQWWAGVDYGALGYANQYQIGYHATQPEYPANAILTVLPSGNVGIGSTTPGAKLDVAGGARFKNQNALELVPYSSLAGNTSELRFDELSTTNTNYVGFKAADTLNTNTIWTLPIADGSNGQVLSTNGGGVLSWSSASSALGNASGDLSGTYPGPTVAQVGGVTASNVASGATAGNNATSANTASRIVMRDASGNFAAGTITANLTGNATNVTGTVAVANGGTGATSFTNNGVLVGSGAFNLSATAAGTQYQVLRAGAGGVPAFGAIHLDQSSAVTGILAVTNGGTGVTTATANQIFAAPNGSNGAPSFRTLVANDIPSLDTAKISAGTFDNARINWAAPGAIGATAAGSGSFTTLTTSGNVGIGTTSPLSPLHIAASGDALMIRPTSMSGGYAGITFADPDGGTTPMNIRYYDDGTPDLAITGGNVGIGTTAPSSKLQISGTPALNVIAQEDILTLYKDTTSNVSWPLSAQFSLGKYALGTTGWNDSNTRLDLALTGWTNNVKNTTTVATFLQNGNVGIGTTSPGNRFQINGRTTGYYSGNMSVNPAAIFATSTTLGDLDLGSHAAVLGLYNNNAYAQGRGGSLALGGRSFDWGGGEYIMTYGRISGIQTPGTNAYAGSLVFETHSQGVIGERMRIDHSGAVGIGTTNPSARLDTAGNIIASSYGNAGEGNFIGLFKDLGALPGYPGNRHPTLRTDHSHLFLSVGGAYSAYITANGAYSSISDRNRKENFVEVDPQEVLRKLDDMPMMEWNFKGENPDIRHIGPIAQDFHAAFHLNGDDDTKISHIDPAGVAIVGVQAISAKLKQLEARNASLEDEVRTLRMILCAELSHLSVCQNGTSSEPTP